MVKFDHRRREMRKRPVARAAQEPEKAVSSKNSSQSFFKAPDIDENFDEECAKAPRFALALGTTVLAVYVRTAFPTVPSGDSGELCFTSCALGVAHPPGYPLFIMLGFIFTKVIPFGSPAFRVNCLSCVCGSVAAAFLYLFCQRWYGYRGIPHSSSLALLPAGLVAFGPLFWQYHVQAEVFSMECCFREQESKNTIKIALLGAFSVGLGFSNQHAIVFYSAPIVLMVLSLDAATGRRLWTLPAAGGLVLAGLTGLTPYAYFPYSARNAPLGSWGDQSTVDGFLTHLLRKEYGTLKLYSGEDAAKTPLSEMLRLYAGDLAAHTLYLGLPAAAAGLLAAVVAVRRDPMGAGTVGMLCAYWVVFHTLSNLPIGDPVFLGVHMRFWLQAHIISIPFLVPGLWAIYRLFAPSSLPAALQVLCVCCGLVAVQAAVHFRVSDQSENRYFEGYAHSMLDNMPRDSIVLSKGDNVVNTMRYLQRCEHHREDVRILDQSMMSYKWFKRMHGPHLPGVYIPGEFMTSRAAVQALNDGRAYSMVQLLDSNLGSSHPDVFLCGGWHAISKEVDSAFKGVPGYRTVPAGLCERVIREIDWPKVDIKKILKENDILGVRNATKGKMVNVWKELDKYDARTWERSIHVHSIQAFHRFGHYLVMYAQSHGDSEKVLKLAIKALSAGLEHWPPAEGKSDSSSRALSFRILAIAHQRLQNKRGGKMTPESNREHVIGNMRRYIAEERTLPVHQEIQIVDTILAHPNARIDIKLED